MGPDTGAEFDAMSFDSFAEFVAMGDHGLYVWLCYGSFIMVIMLNIISVRFASKRFFRLGRAIERRLPQAGETQAGEPQHRENQAAGTTPSRHNQTHPDMPQ